MLDRTIAPPFKRTTAFELFQPEKVTLANGAKVYWVPGGNQEVIKVELVIKAGRWYEKVWGSSYFTSNLLLKGTKAKSSFEVVSIFDLYGAHVEISPGLDFVSVSLYSLTKNLSATLSLLFEVLTESVFPEKELDQAKSIYLQNLKVNLEKTSFQASKTIRKNLFGETHPYGKELEEAEVNAITRDTLVSHFNAYFKDLFIIVSGKISDAHQQLIIDTLSSLPFSPVPENTIELNDVKPFRQLVDKEGSVQASVRIGKRFIRRTDKDYFDTLLLNHILGGYFGSRLMKNIREDKGLSYGIHSGIHTLQQASYLVIGSDVNKENLELTFDEIRKELARLGSERIDAEELETARNHFIGSLQSEVTTAFAHADKIKNIILFNLPADYYHKMISRLDKITADDLMQVGEKYFNEDSFFEVAVG